tara:strand:+ start:2091 stop:2234 length:144 start_codon:yes stop_codon:yes gene_type:complete
MEEGERVEIRALLKTRSWRLGDGMVLWYLEVQSAWIMKNIEETQDGI